MKIRKVRQNNYGVYVWQLPNGKIMADTAGNVLLVQAKYGDENAKKEIARAAAYEGFPEGNPLWEDVHPCSQEEWEEQMEDYKNGILIPEAR